MIRVIAFVIGCFVVSLAGAEIYKTVGSDGSVMYTDKSVDEQSREVKLKPVSVSSPEQNTPTLTLQMLKLDEDMPRVQKTSIKFLKPKNGETPWNQSVIDVVTVVSPELAKVNSVRLLVNNKAYETNETGKFEITYFKRGTQYLRAELIGSDGKVKASSKPITVYVHRTIIRDNVDSTQIREVY